MNIIFVTDENYFKPMFVALESVVKQTSNKNKLNFYIIDLGIKNESKGLLRKRYQIVENVDITFVDFDISKRKTFTAKTHASNASYAKAYIADLIKTDYGIYLDCDVLINTDIKELWDLIEEKIILKAVWNPFYSYDNQYIGIKNTEKTFNSGVMLLNLKKMRENSASSKMINFLTEFNDKTKLQDQAAFNAIFKNDWKELDYSWNFQVSMIQNKASKLGIDYKTYFYLLKECKIIHFTSNSKPWQFRNSHIYKKKYLTYCKSLFPNFHYNEIRMKEVLQKIREQGKYSYYLFVNYFNL